MANEMSRLEEQLQRAFEGGAWHGPSVLEALQGVTAEQAAAQPIPGAHTIWQITLHIAGTYRLVLRRLKGDGRPQEPVEDWPPVSSRSPEDWSEAVRSLRQLNAELRQALRTFPHARLDERLVPESPATAYVQFIGVTQHDLYHAGQIGLLKRALA